MDDHECGESMSSTNKIEPIYVKHLKLWISNKRINLHVALRGLDVIVMTLECVLQTSGKKNSPQ